jgi:hypothetical protein
MFIANKPKEYPIGLLNGEAPKPFDSITGYSNFQYAPGYEEIPGNSYKRNLVNYYAIPYLVKDTLTMGMSIPNSFPLVATQARRIPLPAWMLRA